MAQAYKVTLAPIFRPGVQLDSDGGDIRHVEIDLVVRSNIEFWAMQVNCTVNKAVLEAPFFTPGVVWEGAGGPPVELPTTFNATTGAVSKTISLVNPSTPIGGGDFAINLGTFNFTVKSLAASATSTFVCTSSFLDRNGIVVAPTTYVAPAPLSVLTGYQIAGSVAYQGRPATANAGIQVTCGNNTPVLTGANGAFAVNGRVAGAMKCLYRNANGTPYLAGETWVEVGQGGTRIPPVSLPGGNPFLLTAIPPTYIGEVVDNADLLLVTTNFGVTGVNASVVNGNVNGDTKIDQSDVALVTSNFGSTGPVVADHLLVSYARDYASTSNKKVFLANNATGTLTQAVAGTSKIYNAKLSPDGTKIAYVSEVTAAVVNVTNPLASKLARYALFVAPAPGLTGAPVRLSPLNWDRDAFYPSWSADGSTIAFICSRNYGAFADWDSSTSATPWGNLCTINPSGQNLSLREANRSELFFPAWHGNDGVVYSDESLGLLNYVSFRGMVAGGTISGMPGHMPILRGSVLYYVDDNYTGIIMASNGTNSVFDPMSLPSYGTFPSSATDAFHQDLPLVLGDIEAYEVSDLTQVIYVKTLYSNVITSYQYNGDAVSPNASIKASLQLPQYAYVSCSCAEALLDSIDYAP